MDKFWGGLKAARDAVERALNWIKDNYLKVPGLIEAHPHLTILAWASSLYVTWKYL